jgi:hypothetical protein
VTLSTATYRIAFTHCAHIALIPASEYGAGTAWCQRCGGLRAYESCGNCGGLDCESKRDDPQAACSVERVA